MNAIVENIPAGVCLFDSDLKLIVYNSEFPKLLGVPGEVLERRPSFRDLVRFNAERGEYGNAPVEQEVERRTQSMLNNLPRRTDHVRPADPVPESRNRRLPNGGSVMVYPDIHDTQPIAAQIGQTPCRASGCQ